MSHISSNRSVGILRDSGPQASRPLGGLCPRSRLALLPCLLGFARSARQLKRWSFASVSRLAPRAGPHCGSAPRARSPSLRRRTPPHGWFVTPVSRKGSRQRRRLCRSCAPLRSSHCRAVPPCAVPLRGLPSFGRLPGGSHSVAPLRRSGVASPRPPAGLRKIWGNGQKSLFCACFCTKRTLYFV